MKPKLQELLQTFQDSLRKKKVYYDTYLNDGKFYFHTDDRAVNFYIPIELYRRADRTYIRTLDEISTVSPIEKVIEAVKKELEDNKIDFTILHWFKNKSNITTTKVIKFQKNHFLLPAEFWTGNVTVNSSTKYQKAIFGSTNIILSKVDKATTRNNIKGILDGSIEKSKMFHST